MLKNLKVKQKKRPFDIPKLSTKKVKRINLQILKWEMRRKALSIIFTFLCINKVKLFFDLTSILVYLIAVVEFNVY